MSPGLCTLSLVSYATQQDTVGMMHYRFTMPIYLKEMKEWQIYSLHDKTFQIQRVGLADLDQHLYSKDHMSYETAYMVFVFLLFLYIFFIELSALIDKIDSMRNLRTY